MTDQTAGQSTPSVSCRQAGIVSAKADVILTFVDDDGLPHDERRRRLLEADDLVVDDDLGWEAVRHGHNVAQVPDVPVTAGRSAMVGLVDGLIDGLIDWSNQVR